MTKNGISIQILQIIDGLLVCFAYWLVSNTRDPFRALIGLSEAQNNIHEEIGYTLAIAIPLVPLVLEGTGFYRLMGGLRRSLRCIITGMILSSVAMTVVMVLMKVQAESRYLYLGVPAVLSTMLFFRSWLLFAYRKRRSCHNARQYAVQLVGNDEEVEDFIANLEEDEIFAWDLQPAIDMEKVRVPELVGILKERSVAKVVFLSGKTEFSRLSRAMEVCESMGLEAMVVTDFLRAKISIPEMEKIGGKTVISLRSTPSISYSIIAKKILDRVGAACLIVATLPLWIFAAIGIRLKSPKGPVFFKQKRAGLYGRPFTMWKFRTMHPDAEAMLAKVKEDVGNEMDGPVFKLEKDPRVFGFGDFLRRTSIDELPQLINVLFGEISLVGPRPLPLYEVEEFQKSEHRRRLSVKPGITCFWQAGGRNSITSFEEWVEMDLRYIDNWSFFLDIKILLMTIPAVLLSRGAK